LCSWVNICLRLILTSLLGGRRNISQRVDYRVKLMGHSVPNHRDRAKMSTASHGPQQLGDSIVQDRVHRQRDQFIAAIHEDDVCRLASSYHNGDRCSFFQPPSRGSYNICYFVHFPSQSSSSSEDVEKWVVRIPLAPCLAQGSRSKLESEIATMQYGYFILIIKAILTNPIWQTSS